MDAKNKGIGYFTGVVMIIFVGGLLLTQVAMAMLGGKSPIEPTSQRAYNASGYTHCLNHVTLARAKMSDYFDGFRDASDEELLRWKNTIDKDCNSWLDFQ